MPTEPYLQRLSWQLGERLARAPADFRDRHAAYLRAHQNPDGGWPGREGPSDLYYTGFASGNFQLPSRIAFRGRYSRTT